VKPSELRDKDDAELVELDKELRDKLVKLRMAKAANKAVNQMEFPRIRRDIARINTILTERKLGLERK
jgi:large subunit ribosomal protein L29